MASVQFTVDSSGIDKASKALAMLIGQYEWVTARAMTTAAKAAKAKIAADVFPRIQGGPTNWTQRGLIASFASPKNLTSQVGFNYGGKEKFSESGQAAFKRGGVPAGRYMEVLARGGDRRPKSTELGLRRAGVIGPGQFITPNAKGKGARINAQGNVSGGNYQQILSRLRALPEGSSQNAPRGRGADPRSRSAKGRASVDYFMLRREGGNPSRWQLGAEPSAIVLRAGRGPKGGTGKGSGRPGRPQTVGYKRGFKAAFNVVDQPNYERRFPIQSIALREYQRVFPTAWKAGLEAEMRRPGR